MKITRIWHGKTASHFADDYLRYLEDSGIKEYKNTSGNISVKIWRKIEGDICHFYTVTEWDSYESIKKFAGENYELAKYYDEDAKYLLEFEKNVNHFETFDY